MILRIVFLLLLFPLSSHGKSLTANVMTSMSQTKILRNYSKNMNGIIQTPLCATCQPSKLTVNADTQLIVKGVHASPENLTLISIKEKNELISKSAKLAYPIKDDIPILLEDEARKLK